MVEEMTHACAGCRTRDPCPAEAAGVAADPAFEGRVPVAVCDAHRAIHTHSQSGNGACHLSAYAQAQAEVVCTVTGLVMCQGIQVPVENMSVDRMRRWQPSCEEDEPKKRRRSRSREGSTRPTKKKKNHPAASPPPPPPRRKALPRNPPANVFAKKVESMVKAILHPAARAAAPTSSEAKQTAAAYDAYAAMARDAANLQARPTREVRVAPIFRLLGAYLLRTTDRCLRNPEHDSRRVTYYAELACAVAAAVAWAEGRGGGDPTGNNNNARGACIPTQYAVVATIATLYTMAMPDGLRRSIPRSVAKGGRLPACSTKYLLPPDPWLARLLPPPAEVGGRLKQAGHGRQTNVCVSRITKRFRAAVDTLVDAALADPESADGVAAARILIGLAGTRPWFDREAIRMRARGVAAADRRGWPAE